MASGERGVAVRHLTLATAAALRVRRDFSAHSDQLRGGRHRRQRLHAGAHTRVGSCRSVGCLPRVSARPSGRAASKERGEERGEERGAGLACKPACFFGKPGPRGSRARTRNAGAHSAPGRGPRAYEECGRAIPPWARTARTGRGEACSARRACSARGPRDRRRLKYAEDQRTGR